MSFLIFERWTPRKKITLILVSFFFPKKKQLETQNFGPVPMQRSAPSATCTGFNFFGFQPTLFPSGNLPPTLTVIDASGQRQLYFRGGNANTDTNANVNPINVSNGDTNLGIGNDNGSSGNGIKVTTASDGLQLPTHLDYDHHHQSMNPQMNFDTKGFFNGSSNVDGLNKVGSTGWVPPSPTQKQNQLGFQDDVSSHFALHTSQLMWRVR